MTIKKLRDFLIFWTLFIGIGAFGGGICMLIDPSGSIMGMDTLLPYFQVLPFADIVFQNYIFSGCMLILWNGITQIITFFLLLKYNDFASRAAIICGVILILWICIQFYMFPLNFMDIVYFIFGVLETINGIFLYRKEKTT